MPKMTPTNDRASLSRRSLCVSGTVAAVFGLERAYAQSPYPDRAVRIIVPSAAGTSGDLIARVVAQGWSETLRQPFIVQNIPGAGMNIGTDQAARSMPDGYTILQAMTPNFAINPSLYAKLSFDPARDFEPVGLAISAPNLVVVSNSMPFSDMKGLIAYAKAHHGKMNYASAAIGASGHLTGALINELAGIDMLHIPAKDPLSLVIGEQVQVAIFTPAATLPFINSGRLKAIAVTSDKRLTMAPNIPTITEAGLGRFDANAWYGYAVPKGTPRAIVNNLTLALEKTLTNEKYSHNLLQAGNEIMYMRPDEFGRFAAKERIKWAEAVRRSGAKPE